MTAQHDAFPGQGETKVQNLSHHLPEAEVRQKIPLQAFECSGGLGTAVIVMAVLCIADLWFTRPVAALLVANPSPGGFIAYNFLAVLDLLIGITTFVLVGLWLGRARRNADRIAPGQQRRSRVWVWLGWIVPVVQLWFPKQVIDDVWRSTVRDHEQPQTDWWWCALIAAGALRWLTLPAAGGLNSAGWVVYVLVSVMVTVTGVLWIRIVRTISNAQDALAEPVTAS